MNEYLRSALHVTPEKIVLKKIQIKVDSHCPYRPAGISAHKNTPVCFSTDVEVSLLILAEFDFSQPGGLKALNQSLLCPRSVSKCWIPRVRLPLTWP